jgi:hypothetical protein
MNTGEEHIEFIDEKEPVKESRQVNLRGLVDGTLLTKKAVTSQLPFIFFLMLLGLLYISNRYHADMLRKKIDTYRTEIRDLRSEAIYVSSELMKESMQTEVAEEVQRRGLQLKESIEPPKKIKANNW